MAVYDNLGGDAKKEFSHFNIKIGHSGPFNNIIRDLSAKTRNVFLIDQGEDELRIEKDGVTDISICHFTEEELSDLITILGAGFDRAVNAEIIDHTPDDVEA